MSAASKPVSSRITIREIALHALLLVALLALVFPEPFFSGETLLPAGLLYQYPPWETYATEDTPTEQNEVLIEAFLMFHMFYSATNEALKNGEWPLWNPFEFLGMPLLANYQSAVFYPPRLLHAFRAIPWATTIYLLLKVWLCGMTAYVCARGFGIGTGAARFSAVAYMFGGYVMTWIYWAVPDVAAWLPLLLLSAEWTATGRYKKGFFLMALSGTLMLFAGHPESAFTGALGVGMFFFLRLLLVTASERQVSRTILTASAAWAVVLLVTAVQTLPFFEYLLNSHTYASRGAGEGVPQFLPPEAAFALLVPRIWGSTPDGNFDTSIADNSQFVTMAYAGIVVWTVLLFTAVVQRERVARMVRDRHISPILVAATITLVAAFGPFPLSVFFNLPGLAALWPCYFAAFAMLGLAIAAGKLLDSLDTSPPSLPPLAFLLAALVIGEIFAIHYDVASGEVQVALGFVFLSLVLLAFGRPWKRAVVISLTVLLFLDLARAARGLHGSSDAKWVFPDTELTTQLANQPEPARFNVGSAGIPTGLMVPYGIEEQWGYDGILPARQFQFFGGAHHILWDGLESLTATKYYLHDPVHEPAFPLTDRPDRFRRLGTWDGVEVYENLDARPRATLYGRAVVEPEWGSVVQAIERGAIDPNDTVVLERSPEHKPHLPGRQISGEAYVTERTANSLNVEITSDTPAILMVSEAYYPGWAATIDGEPAEVIPAFHLFRAVPVSAGEHTVQFEYTPATFRVGLTISVVTLILTIAASVWLLARQYFPRGPLREY